MIVSYLSSYIVKGCLIGRNAKFLDTLQYKKIAHPINPSWQW